MSDTEKLMQILSNEDKCTEVSEESIVSLPDESQADLRIKYLHTQIDRLNEEIEGLKQDRLQRKIFGYVIFGFMFLYMIAVLVLVYLQGFKAVCLSQTVTVTLLTTSLASVIGIFNFVVKYLFPNRK